MLLAGSLAAQPAFAQIPVNNSEVLHVTGEAAVNVVPDRVRVFVGVESRNKDLLAAKAENDARVRKVIEAARALNVAPANIQTDYIQVNVVYQNDSTNVYYYRVVRDVQILLTNVEQFEELFSQTLLAGANHVYDVVFSTSELRKHRDAARALAVRAAQEKANDLAAAAGLKVVATPLSIGSYSYGGGGFVRPPAFGPRARSDVPERDAERPVDE